MDRFLSFLKTPKGMVLIGFLVVALVAIPLTVYLVGQQQTLQQSAHTTAPGVSTSCEPAGVSIAYTYNLTNLPAGVTATVTVSDSQGYVTDSFLFANGDQPYSKQVQTNQPSILAGVLTFQTNATDGFQKTNQVPYNATGPCASPSPTQVPSATPSLTPTLTLTPTITPTVSITTTLTLTPTLTFTPTPTTEVTSTPTPTNVPGASNTPTSTAAPTAIAILPPAGPGQTLVTFGLLGALIALIGGIILFAL